MLFSTFTLSTVLLGAANAAILTTINERYVDNGLNALTKRQQFEPTTQTATGDTCADAFGYGYETCRETAPGTNRLCYNPTDGQTCCDSSWACPNGSFCLAEPSCCPNGSDPKTCAAENDIVLSSSFSAVPTSVSLYSSSSTSSFSTSSSSTSSSSATPSSKSKVYLTSSSVVYTTASSSAWEYPVYSSANATKSAAYGTKTKTATKATGTGSGVTHVSPLASVTVASFPGAASNVGMSMCTLVGAALIGLTALFF